MESNLSDFVTDPAFGAVPENSPRSSFLPSHVIFILSRFIFRVMICLEFVFLEGEKWVFSSIDAYPQGQRCSRKDGFSCTEVSWRLNQRPPDLPRGALPDPRLSARLRGPCPHPASSRLTVSVPNGARPPAASVPTLRGYFQPSAVYVNLRIRF